MVLRVTISRPQNAEQIIGAYHRYLQSIEQWGHLKATADNAKAFAEAILIPAWKRVEPILLASLGTRIVGATFTTLPDPRFEYRVPFATGHGTWVAADCRNRGVARALQTQVQGMLKEAGIRRHVGCVNEGNDVSRAAFMKMGFTPDGIVLRFDL